MTDLVTAEVILGVENLAIYDELGELSDSEQIAWLRTHGPEIETAMEAAAHEAILNIIAKES